MLEIIMAFFSPYRPSLVAGGVERNKPHKIASRLESEWLPMLMLTQNFVLT